MKTPVVYWIAALIIVLDQLAKWKVQQSLTFDRPLVLIPRLFELSLVHNTGGAFGILQQLPHSTLWLALAAVCAVIFIIVYISRMASPIHPLLGIALALPLGGAIGNMIDRIRLGHVIDFLHAHFDTHDFPVFNIADSAICIGVGLLIIYFWFVPANVEQEATGKIKETV